jgi:RND family efflux transporter MFP subunit
LPRVSVANPIAREVIDWDDYVGQFEAIQDVTVMPRVSGTITKILFLNGQDVQEGEPLFIIDPRPYQAAYQQAVAATGRAQAVLVNAQAELKRAEMLVSTDAISKTDYDLKVANLRTAEADLNASKAAEATAKLNLEFTTVRASVTGRVSDRRVSVGDVVSVGATQLTRIVTLDPIWFTFEGAESFYLKYVRRIAPASAAPRATRRTPWKFSLPTKPAIRTGAAWCSSTTPSTRAPAPFARTRKCRTPTSSSRPACSAARGCSARACITRC